MPLPVEIVGKENRKKCKWASSLLSCGRESVYVCQYQEMQVLITEFYNLAVKFIPYGSSVFVVDVQ